MALKSKWRMFLLAALATFAVSGCDDDGSDAQCRLDKDCVALKGEGYKCDIMSKKCVENKLMIACKDDTPCLGYKCGSDGYCEIPKCTGAAPAAGEVVINEINGGPATDANCDGEYDKTLDEFFEVVNISGKEVNLAGVALSTKTGEDSKPTTRYTFPQVCVKPGQAVVVFAGGQSKCDLKGSIGLVNGKTMSIPNTIYSASLLKGEDVIDEVVQKEANATGASQQRVQEASKSGGLFNHGSTDIGTEAMSMSPGTCADGSAFADGCKEIAITVPECDDAVTGIAAGDIIINEVKIDVDTERTTQFADCEGQKEYEFVEFYNNSGKKLSLEGLTLSVNGTQKGVVGKGICLKPDQSAVYLPKDSKICSENAKDVLLIHSTVGFANGADSAVFFTGTKDQADYTEIATFAIPSDTKKFSAVRMPDITGETITVHNLLQDSGGNYVGPYSPGLCSSGETLSKGCVKLTIGADPSTLCKNGTLDEGETDIDCGGTTCKACELAKNCIVDGDCKSNICDLAAENATTKTCLEKRPHCTSGAKDGDESDVDCGGSCDKCAIGKACGENKDCLSDNCDAGMCKDVAHCTNGSQDEDESDVDCGGSCTTKCEAGKNCNSGDDCADGLGCIDSQCSAVVTPEAGDLIISEYDYNLFMEVVNVSDKTLSLKGVEVRYADGGTPTKKYGFEDDAVVAKGVGILICTGTGCPADLDPNVMKIEAKVGSKKDAKGYGLYLDTLEIDKVSFATTDNYDQNDTQSIARVSRTDTVLVSKPISPGKCNNSEEPLSAACFPAD